MLITIGVLAYNEAEKIQATLESLFSQSVFTEPSDPSRPVRWHVVVVPNGCTDATAQVAADALQAATARLANVNVSFLVESLDRPGKSNAWNELIHRIAPKDTDVFVMMDADIEYGQKDTIANCIDRLLNDPSARVVVDQPLKHLSRKQNLSLMERLSLQASNANDTDPPGVSGQFYCARAEVLRQIWMPLDLSVEDGFLAAMVISDFFRGAPNPNLIVRAPNATHYFEGLSNIRALINHEVRLVIGTLLNCYLCWDTLLFTTPANGKGAGQTIRDLNAGKPNWYLKMMANQIAARGRWVIPRDMVFRRFINWWRLPWSRRITRTPLSIAAFAFDLIVFYIANRKMVSGRAVGYW